VLTHSTQESPPEGAIVRPTKFLYASPNYRIRGPFFRLDLLKLNIHILPSKILSPFNLQQTCTNMILITLRRFPVIILFSFFNLVRDTSTLYYEGIHQIGRCARFTQIVISEAPAIEPRQAPFPAGGLNHRTVVAFVCLVLAISNSICFPFCTYQFIAL
jgi:hypothetical protein